MPTANETIAHGLAVSQMLLRAYVQDLSPAEMLHRPAAGANCAAWLLGHLTLTDRRVLVLLGAASLPPLPQGFERQFSRDGGCPRAEAFGDVSVLLPAFDAHRAALIEAIRHATAEALNEPLERPNAMFQTVGEFANFAAAHTAMHGGQITIIRRSLGRPPLV